MLFVRNRNTVQTSKKLSVYCLTTVISFIVVLLMFGLTAVFNFWWLYVILSLLYIGHVFSFFLLVLESNNYKLKYYYSKKKFNNLYNELILSYGVSNKKSKKKIKKISSDYFYQYGTLDVMSSGVGVEIFDDWLKKHTFDHSLVSKEEKFDYFVYELLGLCYLGDDYRVRLNNLVNVFDKEEMLEMIDKQGYIDSSFRDKIVFIYDYTSFVTEKFLKTMYIELLFIIEVYLCLISEEKFNNLLYNPNYYYTEDKKMAYLINKDENGFNVLLKNFLFDYEESVFVGCKSEDEALGIIKTNLEKYNEENKL